MKEKPEKIIHKFSVKCIVHGGIIFDNTRYLFQILFHTLTSNRRRGGGKEAIPSLTLNL